MHAPPARGQVVTQLVDENEHPEHDEESEAGAQYLGNEMEHDLVSR